MSIAVGIIFVLLPKSPPLIAVSLIAIFALLFHPIWHFWWIERAHWRRILTLAIFASLLTGLGYSQWPNPTKDLKMRAEVVVKNIRGLNQRYGDRIQLLQDRLFRKEMDDATFQENRAREVQSAAEEYGREIHGEAMTIRRELKRRIPSYKRPNVGLPDINPADPNAKGLSMYDISSSPFDFYWSELLAKEIDQLARVLPD